MANEGGEWIMKGLSAEEHVSPRFWWTGDPEQDPWEWREIIPAGGREELHSGVEQRKSF